MKVAVALSIAVVLLAGVARADIYEWKDSAGVRHFTNVKDQVPAPAGRATVFVHAAEVPASPAPASAAASSKAEPAREAQVVYDRSSLDAAYAEGYREAMAARQAPPAAVSVQVNAPLVAASAPVYAGGYSRYPYRVPYRPLVTTSFDRGRSRFMTLRMLLQDQFALDREGPYVVDRYLPPFHYPPLGPNLAVFLPRGLPHFRAPLQRAINY